MPKATRDIIFIIVIAFIAFLFFRQLDVLELIVNWSHQHENLEIDELISTSIVLVFLLLFFSVRRLWEVRAKTFELEKALAEIETLKGIIPICIHCKKIRDDEGVWNQLEIYFRARSAAQFSHGLCPECFTEEMDKINNL